MTLTTRIADTEAPDAEHACRPQRVLVVDENELFQVGLASVFGSAPWVAGCYLAGSAESAVTAIRRYQPQLILVSTSLEGRSSVELCRWITDSMPHIKVVLTSGEGRIPRALAQSLGAVGAFSKHMPRAAILEALKLVAEGGQVFPKSLAAAGVQLSRRELDVLQHVASGLSNPETASTLNLSRHTVKQHTSAVYRKLGVRNRAEAANRARELGLLT